MSTEGQEKRDRFFAENPDIAMACDEIRKGVSIADETAALERLASIKQHAVRQTSYYSRLDPNGVFPVVSKADYISHYGVFRAGGGYRLPLHVSRTSGSTGVPFSVEQDFMKRRRTIADLKVFGEMALYPSHERMVQLRSYNGSALDRAVDRRENIWRWDAAHMDDNSISRLWDFIQAWQPKTLFGYTSVLEMIADWVIDKGLESTSPVTSVLVGAETLSDGVGEKITKAFGCPLFDRYSNQEMGIYAQREWGKGGFVFNWSSYYLEILREDSDEAAPIGELGRIVVTDLFNRAFPMIRYDTGDLGVMAVDHGKKVLSDVWGRRVDRVFDADGSPINPHGITNGMWGIAGIRQWQLAQMNYGKYEMRVCADHFASVDEREIRSRLLPVLGQAAQIAFKYTDGVPELRSGKRKHIVNEMPLEIRA